MLAERGRYTYISYFRDFLFDKFDKKPCKKEYLISENFISFRHGAFECEIRMESMCVYEYNDTEVFNNRCIYHIYHGCKYELRNFLSMFCALYNAQN